jgi:COP9 signalosome complex subunit 2
MKAIYPKTLGLTAAVADPRIIGIIREEGGKMYMGEKRWTEAYEEFYEGFRGYQVYCPMHRSSISLVN